MHQGTQETQKNHKNEGPRTRKSFLLVIQRGMLPFQPNQKANTGRHQQADKKIFLSQLKIDQINYKFVHLSDRLR